MTRWLRLGLAGLALMVAPFSEAAAQAAEVGPAADPVAEQTPTPATSGEAGTAPSAIDAVQPARVPDGVLSIPGAKTFIQDDLAPGAVIVGEGQPMGIEEAVAMSIQNGLGVEVERFGPLIAEANADASWGSYDPTVSGDYLYDVAKALNVSPFNSAPLNRDRTHGGSVGVNQMIPYLGASLDARFSSNSFATRSSFAQYEQQYNTSFFLSATVPLLRNLVWNQNWTNVKLTGFQSDAASQQFLRALMDTVQATVNSYCGLVAARDRVRVAQKSLETARALLDQTRTQYEVGVVSQVEVVEAEAGVANREFDLIRNANEYRNAQDVLIDAVLGAELKPATELQIVPTAALTAHGIKSIDVEGDVAQAFENRPELKIAQSVIEQGEVSLKFAKSQRLPQLDVVGRYGYVGIGGRPNTNFSFPGNPPAQSTAPRRDYGNSMDGFFQGNAADNYRVQGLFSVPIPNTRGRELVSRSEFDLRRSQSSRIRLEQQIILEVRAASRTLLAAAQGIEAAERRRLAAEEQLRAERIRLEHGESTPFEVLQREEDLVEAESQKINALQTFHAAETALERARGSILEAHAIDVDAARRPVR
ncbi:MAG: TolC family protein [Deltaproteobacteria bacterium]|nr:TolC family protein [Deltaproteobacteria bacterium]